MKNMSVTTRLVGEIQASIANYDFMSQKTLKKCVVGI